MPFTIGQAQAVNRLICHLTGTAAAPGHPPVSRTQAIDALLLLNQQAYAALGAGIHPDEVQELLEQHWPHITTED